MSNSKTRTEIERLVEALDEVAVSDVEAQETVKRLGIDTKAWAGSVRAKITAAETARRQARFAQAEHDYRAEAKRLESQVSEPGRSVDEQRRRVKALIARAPRETTVSMHFHKFDEATEEELAEMIKSLRHLLGDQAGDDDDEG
jgi:hypothetical protein